MKKNYFPKLKPARHSPGEGGFFNLRALIGFLLCFSGVALALFAHFSPLANQVSVSGVKMSVPKRYLPVPGGDPHEENAGLAQMEQYWHNRVTYPTGRFDPAWLRAAAAQHARMASSVPSGPFLKLNLANPNALSTTNFTALGPQPERMTGCSGCFDYTTTEGRVDDIAVDPTTTTNG